jgi:hypothetical protein
VSAIVAAIVSRLFAFTEGSYRAFWPNRYWVLVHFLGSSIALICGLPQFSAPARTLSLRVSSFIEETALPYF